MDLPSFEFPDTEGPSDQIEFYSEDVEFALAHSTEIKHWIRTVIADEGYQLTRLNFIFCSDPYLHRINLEFLQHDTYTDIITFPLADAPKLEGDVYLSIDRVRENAKELDVPFTQELHRVIVHGVLHLCGYGDKTEAEKKQMRAKEDEKLTLLSW